MTIRDWLPNTDPEFWPYYALMAFALGFLVCILILSCF